MNSNKLKPNRTFLSNALTLQLTIWTCNKKQFKHSKLVSPLNMLYVQQTVKPLYTFSDYSHMLVSLLQPPARVAHTYENLNYSEYSNTLHFLCPIQARVKIIHSQLQLFHFISFLFISGIYRYKYNHHTQLGGREK